MLLVCGVVVLLCNVVLLFIFFFKQKTAYEMRISDWSSDVCSSDLSWRTARRARAHVGDPQPLFEACSAFGVVEGCKADDMYAQQRAVAAGTAEIGRASCRERVCQYV